MSTKSFELRELFHLTFLRQLGARLSGRSYAVKGGICLRFFHRSSRLSEDIDLDVVSQVRVETLRKAVDSVIDGGAMLATLMPAGVSGIRATKSKQTETTQRWKIALQMNGEELHAKIEFSRRHDHIRHSTGVPDSNLLRRYGVAAFAAQYYDAPRMSAQKIAALAAEGRNALRDFFDLHHLFFTMGCRPEEVNGLLEAGMPKAAAEKVLSFTFEVFQEQVVPYLTAELMDLYRDSAVFEKQKDEALGLLLGMME
ncbi:MAG: nucleotidyl transferase AbiEii/AbiGii toxin family protein [Elusimicrobia bacterium]|nr:nucleotidyl transferase AbiEii/AbiGii toxin family protein [Elusimicrobiota bacterium]